MRFYINRPKDVYADYLLLIPNSGWNDYHFITTFRLFFHDAYASEVYLGEVKIGFQGQSEDEPTSHHISSDFGALQGEFFSLGQDETYYENINNLKGGKYRDVILKGLRDVVYDEAIFDRVYEEAVFVTSLTRFVSLSSIKDQFRRIIFDGERVAKYGFVFSPNDSSSKMNFAVDPTSKPPSNLHVLIGRNGAGKTSFLRSIANSIDGNDGVVTTVAGGQVTARDFGQLLYFSLGVFDNPLSKINFNDSRLSMEKTKKKYIGIYSDSLKKNTDQTVSNKARYSIKDFEEELPDDFFHSLHNCLFGSEVKRDLWLRCVKELETDVNFAEKNVSGMVDVAEQDLEKDAKSLFTSLSSGHAAVLYYITAIAENLEEKTICLFDEPENHLHPPLLSAFIRAVSGLMAEKNGMAIIATHSPVILQEVPRSCVWKVERRGQDITVTHPSIETFGENVGEITSEIFGLDIRRTGFYRLLEQETYESGSYEAVMEKYQNEIGLEGRAVVLSTVKVRR